MSKNIKIMVGNEEIVCQSVDVPGHNPNEYDYYLHRGSFYWFRGVCNMLSIYNEDIDMSGVPYCTKVTINYKQQ